VPFSALEGFLLVIWTLVAQFLVLVPAMVLGLLDPTEGGPMLLVMVITAQGLGLAGALGYLSARGRLSWRLLGPRRPAGRHVAIGLGVGVGGFVLVNLVIQALLRLVGPVDPPEQQLLTDVTAGGATTLLAVMAAVVMAPLVEEVVFRGVLFQGLKRRVGLWPAAFLSGLLFAIVHVEVQQPVYSSGLLLLGVLFGWTMHRFGTLLVPLVAHATFNAISVGLTLLGARLLDTV
jgi:membrane protease YdiL (CAAX protease family)